jgi:hypothetical protein
LWNWQTQETYKAVHALGEEVHVLAEQDADSAEEEGALALVVVQVPLLVPVQREPAQAREGLQAPVDDALFNDARHQSLCVMMSKRKVRGEAALHATQRQLEEKGSPASEFPHDSANWGAVYLEELVGEAL